MVIDTIFAGNILKITDETGIYMIQGDLITIVSVRTDSRRLSISVNTGSYFEFEYEDHEECLNALNFIIENLAMSKYMAEEYPQLKILNEGDENDTKKNSRMDSQQNVGLSLRRDSRNNKQFD